MKYKSEILTSGLFSSPEKEEIRKLLLSNTPKRAFTLAGPLFKDAKLLTSTFNCSVRSIERDTNIYNKQLKAIKRGDYPKIHLSNENFSDYVKDRLKYEAPFDLMFLDFQGIINKRLENDLTNMFKQSFEREAIIAITLSKSRDGYEQVKDTYCFQKVCGYSYEEYRKNREQAISTTTIALARQQGYRLKEIKKNRRTYCNNKKGAPMMFLMFKVI